MKPFKTPKCTKYSNMRIISADNTNVLSCNPACNDVTRTQITKSRARVGNQALTCLSMVWYGNA